jgi:2-succinyl-5-enolpyruvyl-6-hydroxy-3-cyclohexene-1-carboxylate synthase
VHTLCEALPAGSFLVVGNSLPPRLIDRYCPAAARQLRVLSQRGASGIDGLVAGALGSASQADAATTLVCGDISFLHDVGSLWAASSARTHGPALQQAVLLVVLNNGGGRIFDQLPMAKQAGEDQRYWTTPHDLHLRGAAELYGLRYAQVRERDELRAALAAAYARPEVSLVEIVVDPNSAALRLQQLAAELEPNWSEVLASS